MQASTVILLALVTSIVTTVSTVYVMDRYDIVGGDAPAEVVVPNLKGLTEAEARSTAAAADLAFNVIGQEATAEAKPGVVLRQSVLAGQKVLVNHPVSVVLAEELPKVPLLAGMTVEAATARLKEAGYAAQLAGSVADPQVPVGQVAKQMPEANAPYVKGAAVTIQVSSGPAEIEMPKLIGKPFQQAQKAVEALGLKSVIGWISEGETPEYVILQQNPAPGEKVEPGSTVRFTVNR